MTQPDLRPCRRTEAPSTSCVTCPCGDGMNRIAFAGHDTETCADLSAWEAYKGSMNAAADRKACEPASRR